MRSPDPILITLIVLEAFLLGALSVLAGLLALRVLGAGA